MKVSIITSCYNREATIRGAIESVLEQDYPYIEYIVVDGASKDNSLAVINEYKNGQIPRENPGRILNRFAAANLKIP